MTEILNKLGFKESKGLYYLENLNEYLSVCRCIAVISTDHKGDDCIGLMFEWSQNGKLRTIEITKEFYSVDAISKAIEDFKNYQKEYL